MSNRTLHASVVTQLASHFRVGARSCVRLCLITRSRECRAILFMDGELYTKLKENGVSDSTMNVLLEEDVSTRDTFTSLEREHLRKLALKLTIGQHAVILKVWKILSGR